MKKMLLTALIIALLPVLGFATDFDSPVFNPVTPEVWGQGGSFTAVAKGYNSLFTNPAGFAREGGSFTLLSATASPYFVPSEEQVTALSEIGDTPEDAIDILADVITTNGIGAGISGGLGLVGKGLGLGLVSNVDFYGKGVTAAGTNIDVTYTFAGIAGYAVPLNLGFSQLYIGGDVRYMVRKEMKDIKLSDFLDDSSAVDFNVLYGNGLAVDAGAIMELGPFNLGLSLRDIGGTTMSYSGAVLPSEEMAAFFAPGASEMEPYTDNTLIDGNTYTIPMTVSYGLAYHLDLGLLSWLVDPTFHVEYRDTMYQEYDPSTWTKIHAGTEVRVLRFIKLRAGINQGYATAGIGMKLLFLDVNAAYFTREMGTYAGTLPNEGFSLEAAIRF